MANQIKNSNNETLFIKAPEVAVLMDVSRAYAYRIIKQLNAELKEQGVITIDGRTNRKYFYERFYGTVSA